MEGRLKKEGEGGWGDEPIQPSGCREGGRGQEKESERGELF